LRVVFRQNDPGWHPTEVDWASSRTTIQRRRDWPAGVAARLPGQNLSAMRFEHWHLRLRIQGRM